MTLRFGFLVPVFLSVCLFACGDDDNASRGDSGDGDGGVIVPCRESLDCDDGVFCNGVERCRPEDDRADAQGCVPDRAPSCDDGIACTFDMCAHEQNRCLFVPIDQDDDGHASAACLGPDSEPLGDDCDDADPYRYPGNVEVCSQQDPEHDEDCIDQSFGVRDVDGDGAQDATCCNVSDDGDRSCGTDCDDTSARVRDDYPELCDGVDNDCDGTPDDDTIEVPWYVDADGDGYGDPASTAVASCAIIVDRSVIGTDCDDTHAAQHPAARELCNGIDDDCDTHTDEGEACSCGSPGAVQPCVCGDNRSGFHLCLGDGRWDACDCRECVDGSVDCLASLIPRACVAGRWIASTACNGITPLCTLGQCVCIDGTQDCTTLIDPVPPFVQALIPGDRVSGVPVDSVVSAVLSEAIDSSSINATSFTLVDIDGVAIPAVRHTQGNSVTLVPSAPLEPGRVYTAEIAAVTDVAGNPLASPRTWKFMTEVDVPATTLSTDVVLSPITLHAWPNETALVTYNFTAVSRPGKAVITLAGANHTLLFRQINADLCVPPCLVSTSLWALAQNGTLGVLSGEGHAWAGPNLAGLADLGVALAADDLRYANDSMLVLMDKSPFRLETHVGVAIAGGNAGIQPNVVLVGSPVLATNTRPDLLSVVVTDNSGPHNVNVAYGRGAIPSNSFVAAVLTTDVEATAAALNASGQGLAAWVNTYSVGVGGGGIYVYDKVMFARVSATGVVSPAVTLTSADDSVPLDQFQVVAAGDVFWIVYRRSNQVHAVRVTATGVDPVIVASDGPRVRGVIDQVQASAEPDGTLHIAWLDTELDFDVADVVSARRVRDGVMSRIDTLFAGGALDHLRSATYGTGIALTTVAETDSGSPIGLYAIRH